MKFPFKSLLVIMSIGATAAVGSAYAQEAQDAAESTTAESAPVEGVPAQNAKAEVVFTPLMRWSPMIYKLGEIIKSHNTNELT